MPVFRTKEEMHLAETRMDLAELEDMAKSVQVLQNLSLKECPSAAEDGVCHCGTKTHKDKWVVVQPHEACPVDTLFAELKTLERAFRTSQALADRHLIKVDPALQHLATAAHVHNALTERADRRLERDELDHLVRAAGIHDELMASDIGLDLEDLARAAALETRLNRGDNACLAELEHLRKAYLICDGLARLHYEVEDPELERLAKAAHVCNNLIERHDKAATREESEHLAAAARLCGAVHQKEAERQHRTNKLKAKGHIEALDPELRRLAAAVHITNNLTLAKDVAEEELHHLEAAARIADSLARKHERLGVTPLESALVDLAKAYKVHERLRANHEKAALRLEREELQHLVRAAELTNHLIAQEASPQV